MNLSVEADGMGNPVQGFECPIEGRPKDWCLEIQGGRTPVSITYSESKLPERSPAYWTDRSQYADFKADLKVRGFNSSKEALKGYECLVEINGQEFPASSLKIESSGDRPVKVTIEFSPSHLEIDLKGVTATKRMDEVPSYTPIGKRMPIYLYGYCDIPDIQEGQT